MKRAHAVHFLPVLTDKWIGIKASLTMKENIYSSGEKLEKFSPSFPIQAYRLLNAYHFKMKIVIKDENLEPFFEEVFESDSYGSFQLKIPLNELKIDTNRKVHIIEAYEVGKINGLEMLLGTYLPLDLKGPKKYIICDFDKTLVDTKYSTPEEIYYSLTSPIDTFPTLTESIELFKKYFDQGFHPFILSASPHFYENAIRDWLYANNIYTAGIFLKDYRRVFSFLDSDLSPKDLKVQGIYKLGHLLDIIYLTGVPEEMVLMGDNFESDPIIYLTFYELFYGNKEPRQIWKTLKDSESFKLNHKQNSLVLNKIFELSDAVKRSGIKPKIHIYIRKRANEKTLSLPANHDLPVHAVTLYETSIKHPPKLKSKKEAQVPTK